MKPVDQLTESDINLIECGLNMLADKLVENIKELESQKTLDYYEKTKAIEIYERMIDTNHEYLDKILDILEEHKILKKE